MDLRAEPWPDSPYKGLSPYGYGSADRALFAARETDTQYCDRLLGLTSTRLLVLHGPTGCGKTSFLRAALLPHLDGSGQGYFLPPEAAPALGPRGGAGDADGPALFVRSTARPLSQLARAVFWLADPAYPLEFRSGQKEVDLSDARLSHDDATEFEKEVGRDHRRLVDAVGRLARRLPGKLVLVVDQAEEMFTLNPGEDGRRDREVFFDFLTMLGEIPVDLKLIASLRTEFYGRFANQVHRRNLDTECLREYMLLDLDATDLRRSILRPTDEAEFGSLGSPRDHYQFTYEPELVDRLVADLIRAAPQGGVLPVLQIVCGRLYQKTRPRGGPPPDWTIKLSDYEGFGRVVDMIDGYFTDAIRGWCTRSLKGQESQAIEDEVERWRKVLYRLVRRQPDGTVTTDLLPAETLEDAAREADCKLPLGPTARHLSDEPQRVLRKSVVPHQDTGQPVTCYSLGHDVIGQALLKWKIARDSSPRVDPVGAVEADTVEGVEPGVALCLNGVGFRAALFHLGALWRLNDAGFLSKVDRVSGVGGGAVVAALLGSKWRRLRFDASGRAGEFERELARPLRAAADVVNATGLDGWGLIFTALQVYLDFLMDFHYFRYFRQSERLAREFARYLFGDATLQDLPERPRVVLAATNVQSGALWRFSAADMGDYRVGRARAPRVSLSAAVVASAAYPPLLSPFELHPDPADFDALSGLDLQTPPYLRKVMLTTGSVIDPLALETAWKRCQTVLVSDALDALEPNPDTPRFWLSHMFRFFALSDNSFLTLRRRQVDEALKEKVRSGAYWGIRDDIAQYGLDDPLPCPRSLTRKLAEARDGFSPVKADEQERLINWGYAASDAALRRDFLKGEPRPAGFPYPMAGLGG